MAMRADLSHHQIQVLFSDDDYTGQTPLHDHLNESFHARAHVARAIDRLMTCVSTQTRFFTRRS
jgi:hypothetical protein